MRGVHLVACGALVVVLTACGGDGGSSARPNVTNLPSGAQETGPPPTPSGGKDMIGGRVSTNVGSKPIIGVPPVPPPTTLQTKDIVVGTGQVAGDRSTVTAHLIGVHWANGKTFYSSWDKAGGAPDE